MRAAQAVRHRTLWISDVHLGSPGCKARQLTEFLRYNHCDRLYLVGDIFDGWKLKSSFYWTTAHTRVIQAVIAMARRGTRVYYLTGNHDDFMRKFVRSQIPLGRVRLANEVIHTTADGRRLLVLHGDVFDDVVNTLPWLAHAGDIGYELLMRSNRMINRVRSRFGMPYWSFSAFAKNHVKAAVQYLSGFDDKVLLRCKKYRLKGVICGHTHHAEVRSLLNGITSYNCGDWVESCTALAEDFKGNIRILSAAEHSYPQPARAATSDLPERVPETPVEPPLPAEAPGRRVAAPAGERRSTRRRRPAGRPAAQARSVQVEKEELPRNLAMSPPAPGLMESPSPVTRH